MLTTPNEQLISMSSERLSRRQPVCHSQCLPSGFLHTITALRDSTVTASVEVIRDGSPTRENGFRVSVTILFSTDFYEFFVCVVLSDLQGRRHAHRWGLSIPALMFGPGVTSRWTAQGGQMSPQGTWQHWFQGTKFTEFHKCPTETDRVAVKCFLFFCSKTVILSNKGTL